MAWFKKTLRQRRLEIRRAVPERAARLVHWFRRRGMAAAVALAAIFFVAASLLDVWPMDPLPYRLGQYIPADITARVTFRVLLPTALDEAKRKADSSAPATFRLNTALVDETVATLEKAPSRMEAAKALESVDVDLRKRLGLYPPPKPAPQGQGAEPPATQPADPPSARDRKAFDAWLLLAKPESRQTLEAISKRLREELIRCYVIHPDRAAQEQERAAQRVVLTDGQTEVRPKIVDLVSLDETPKIQRLIRPAVLVFPKAVQGNVETFLLGQLQSKPLYVYDPDPSKKDRDAAVQEVAGNPPDTCFKEYQKGTVLAQSTESLLISPEVQEAASPQREGLSEPELKLLRSEHTEYLVTERQSSPLRPWLRIAGRVIVVFLLTMVLCVYVMHYQAHLVEHTWNGLALVLLLLMMLGISKVFSLLPWSNPNAVLLPVCMAGIILTISYDQRFALAIASILSAFVVFQIRGGFGVLVVLIGALVLCVFQLREIRTRSRLIVVSAVSSVVIFAVVWALSIQTGAPWRFALHDSIWAAGAVLLAGLIVQALLPAVEWMFGVATGSTLLEWCDASKPLLKRLAMESPGTYNHSLQLGAMCEAAAEAIGARGLVARVGAYYHDIGKINKPEYFAENQPVGESKHDKLSPAMSLLIIINHVKDGLEMARQYGLPKVLREFIATHHGTTLVRYFYHSAAQQSDRGQGPAPDESHFRYPGPKPESKEPAILMLADAAESSVRAMSDPTPARIRAQVNRIITERLEDGQLDECDLTLREVHRIEDSLVKSLCGMYHSRIAYPKDEREDRAEGARKDYSGARNGAHSPPPEEPEADSVEQVQ